MIGSKWQRYPANASADDSTGHFGVLPAQGTRQKKLKRLASRLTRWRQSYTEPSERRAASPVGAVSETTTVAKWEQLGRYSPVIGKLLRRE